MLEDLIYVLTKYDTWLWRGFLLTFELLVISVICGTLLAIPLPWRVFRRMPGYRLCHSPSFMFFAARP